MLRNLSIKNFALIEQLQVSFEAGLITITGETGAGKSLLLGALGLLLGKRADLNSVKNSDKKCSIEGVFDIESYNLSSFFEEKDLDFESETIIRREILPSGKSRAFINDTPVTLQALQALGVKLIDIHSQHQTLEVTSNDFQLQVIDVISGTQKAVQSYQRGLKLLKEKEKELSVLIDNRASFTKEFEYNSYMLKELEEAGLKVGELAELEEQYETLSNIEAIQERLSMSINLLGAEQTGIEDQLQEVRTGLSKISGFGSGLKELASRVDSIYIELADLGVSLQHEWDRLESDPEQLQKASARLQLLHDLQIKHGVSSIDELIVIKNELNEKVGKTESLSDDIDQLQNEIKKVQSQLDEVALKIHKKRENSLPKFIKKLEQILTDLGMPNGTFQAGITLQEKYLSAGKDTLEFLFSANKGGVYGELKKVASGGELSRIMLAIKAILSKHVSLPTIIFDEIDTGVSGEVAHKMADVMKEMSHNLQVFSITHLPQIAANGQSQYKVFKQDINETTVTNLKLLTMEERVTEIAEMIGGKDVSTSALTHAKSLLLK